MNPSDSGNSPVMDAYAALEAQGQHRGGAFPTIVLQAIERLLPAEVAASAETGCGKSTVLLSNLSYHHTVFCLDDRHEPESSVAFYEGCPLTRLERVHPVFGPTQITLSGHAPLAPLDIVLIDGPHGWPFPEIEYYFFYPTIRNGGVLIIDDVTIPTIGHMADVIAEDGMWDLVEVVYSTAILRRTDAPMFDPTGDGWWTQRYNKRRVAVDHAAHGDDGGRRNPVTSHFNPLPRKTPRSRFRRLFSYAFLPPVGK